MSDPTDSSESPLRNPPGARRRGRRPRSVPVGEPGEPDLLPVAPAPATPSKRPLAAPPPAPPPAAKQEKTDRKPSRGKVCPHCGKYHDITDRPVGSAFECKCGAELIVPPVRENPITRPAEVTLRVRELQTRHRLSMVAMIVGYLFTILLLSATLYLLVTERQYISGTCAGIAAIAFLVVGVIGTNEWRRTSAELAAERVDERH